MTEIPFVVRLLPNNVPLKAAYRIHLTPEALHHLQLKVGDLCCITSEDGTRGAAIAWRAMDKMGSSPKIQPAKMSETLCDTFGFKQGTQVRIEKLSDTSIRSASSISLVDITPEDWEQADDNRWNMRCAATLMYCEAVAIGMSFEVHASERSKRRYYIEHIDNHSSSGTQYLHICDDDSTIKHLDGATSPSTSAHTQQQQLFQMNAAHIGGLADQVHELNQQLQMLCMKAKSGNKALASNYGILIHGFEGTGKSMLLNALEKVQGFKRVTQLTHSDLLNTPSKNRSLISDTFEHARSSQPSLVLIDKLDEIAPHSDSTAATTTDALCRALDSIHGTEVLVVATARSKHKISSELFSPDRFTTEIELPVPDQAGRTDILASLLPHTLDQSMLVSTAAVTHGYTGCDLARLVKEACRMALKHYIGDLGVWHNAEYSTLRPQSPALSSANGRAGSVATTLVERPSSPDIVLSQADLDAAVQLVRPSALREIIVEPPNISFADIGGSEALHARFDRTIEWPLKYPELYGKRPRGILLYGPPGCSKTMTAQAVAKTYGWNFIAIRGAELISMYVGESERALREIFRRARQASPAIVFFDEIDSIATSRSSSSDSSKGLNVLTTLLNEIDGFSALKNVLVLAATNRPEILDPAILRSGRFDQHIYLGPPDAHARRAILGICIKGNPHSMRTNIDLDALIIESDGMSGAELRGAWQSALEQAIARFIQDGSTLELTTEDVVIGIQQTFRGITKEMLEGYANFAGRRF